MLLTDLVELKKILEIDPLNTAEDTKLGFFIEQASQWIEEYLGRPGLAYKARTEYYGGTGTQKIQLRSRPVFTSPTVQVFVDESGYYGSASGSFDATNTALTYGTDFALDLDQEDGSSRSGILIRIGNYWPRPQVRQRGYLSPFIGQSFGNVKVIYTAGWTQDTIPASVRLACNTLVARLRHIFPLGLEMTSESYEDRSIGWAGERKDYLMALVKPMLYSHRNWRF